MGLFDELTIAYPMPKGYEQYQSSVFQTKDLDCYMLEYVIDEHGHLFERNWHVEPIPETERKPGLLGIIRTHTRTGTYSDKQILFHGDIEIYATVDGTWQDFIVRFTNGKVQHMLPWKRESDNLVTRYEIMHNAKIQTEEDPSQTE